MNNSRIAYKCLIAAVCALAAAAAVLLYFAQTVGYDLSIQHFAKGSPYAISASVCIGVAFLTGMTAAILRARTKAEGERAPLSALSIFAASCTAFLLLASFIVSIRHLSEGLPILKIIQLVLMALSAAYFLLTAAKDAKNSGAFALVSLCPMLYAVISLLLSYFDTAYAMNSPLKSYLLLTHISLALFFSAEARSVIKKPSPALYTFFGVCCLTLTAALGLSQLAMALHDTVGHNFSVLDSAARIAISVYTAARLFSLGSDAKAEETNEQ